MDGSVGVSPGGRLVAGRGCFVGVLCVRVLGLSVFRLVSGWWLVVGASWAPVRWVVLPGFRLVGGRWLVLGALWAPTVSLHHVDCIAHIAPYRWHHVASTA